MGESFYEGVGSWDSVLVLEALGMDPEDATEEEVANAISRANAINKSIDSKLAWFEFPL